MENENYVRMAKCAYCGKENGEILLHKQFKEISEEKAFSTNPCIACKNRFKTMKFFIGNCGHSGFIGVKALKKITAKESWEGIEKSKIFRMKKCFTCMSGDSIDTFGKL